MWGSVNSEGGVKGTISGGGRGWGQQCGRSDEGGRGLHPSGRLDEGAGERAEHLVGWSQA